MTELNNGQLLTELDDVVQRLSKKNNIEWAELRTEDKMLFERIKLEIYARLERLKVNEITNKCE